MKEVKEAIHIKCKASDLNKDKGRHQLPSVYDSIISSDRSLTSGQMIQSPANSNTNIVRHRRSVDADCRPPNVQNFVKSFIDIRFIIIHQFVLLPNNNSSGCYHEHIS